MRVWHNKPEKPRQVSLDLLCFCLSLKRRQVQYLSKRGILKKASFRSFFLTDSVRGYIQNLKSQGRWAGDEVQLNKLLEEIDSGESSKE